MSTVMRPRGPLPPRVYWTRRVLVIALLCLVAALLWWVLPGPGGSGNASADQGGAGTSAGGQSPSDGHPATSSPPAGHGHQAGAGHGSGTTGPSSGSSTTSRPPTTSHPSKPASKPKHQGHQGHQGHQHSQLVPSGPCDPATVVLSVAAKSAPEGSGTTIGLRMSTPDGSTCSLGVSPNVLDTRITSGQTTIWQSQSCPDALPAKNVVVGPKPRRVYSFRWDGQFNPSSCSATNVEAKPGAYWAEAALVGGEPRKSYFEITSPSNPANHT